MRLLSAILIPAYCFAAGASLEIDSVIDLARSAPPEVAADALIRVADLELAKQRKVELLEQAFRLASAAPQLYKRRSALVHPVGPSGFLNRAFQQDLDANSLELRAVAALLALDAKRARERFQDIPPLKLPPLTCDEFLVYDVDRFYDVLGRVASESFTAKEIRDDEPSKFLALYIARIGSPVEVAPAARMLAGVAVSEAGFQSLATSLAGALGRMSGDSRSFSSSAGRAGSELLVLIELGRRRQVSPVILAEAYRLFLVHHLSAGRCKEQDESDPAGFFNDHVQMPSLRAIGETESAPVKVEGEAKGLQWCESPECKAVREEYLKLVTRQEGRGVQPAEREQGQWQATVRDFLSTMAGWTQSSGATPAEYFREKIGFYNDVLTIVPNGPTREFVLRSMIGFLDQNRLPPENRIEWLLAVNQLVGRVALDPLGLGRVAADLRGATDVAISLSIALETVAPRPAGELMLLL